MSLTRPVASLPGALSSTYAIDKILGVGAYAIVYRIQNKKTSEAFALKVIEIEPMRIRLMVPQLDREVQLMEEFTSGPHMAQLLEVTRTSTHVFLRFAICQQSLEDLAMDHGPMSEEDALNYLREACLGVQGLHAGGVVHRDLKPSNLLVDSEGMLRICDFGWACWEEQELTGTCGTPEYSSPETCMKEKGGDVHTSKVDIYGLGACLQHLLLGRVPRGPADLPKGLSAATMELLSELLDSDPDARPTVDELLQRPQLMGNTLVAQLWSRWQSLFDVITSDGGEPRKSTKQKNMEAEMSCGLGGFY